MTDDNQLPTQEQISAFRYLVEHDKAIVDSITEKIMSESPWWQYDESDDFDLSELCERIEVETVFVHTVSKKGVAYLGFEGSCDWADEHGLGVLMHLDDVIAIGGADVSFLDWIARDDARSSK